MRRGKSVNKFHFKSCDELYACAAECGVNLPRNDDFSCLAQSKTIDGSNVILKNRLTIHPMEGFDGEEDGSPSSLTFRRCERFAQSGAGLIWLEATSVVKEGRTSRHQLWITKENLDSYKRLAEMMHEKSGGIPLILQLTHSGRFSRPDNTPAPVISYHNPLMNEKMMIDPDYPTATDEYFDSLPEKFGEAAKLAKEAGFDGADIKCCHKYLFSELLSAYNREGRYGGSFENRTRLFVDSIKAAQVYAGPDFILASRFGPYDCLPYPWGFGADREDYLKIDWEEPDRLYRLMAENGIRLVDMTLGSPYINPHVNRPYDNGGYEPPEERLTGVARLIDAAAHLKKTVPSITLIGTGYTYLRQYAPYAAAGAVSAGMTDAAGFGRMAFAYPDFAADILTKGTLDSHKVCLTCSKCTALMRAMSVTGCPIRDKDTYLPIYQSVFQKI